MAAAVTVIVQSDSITAWIGVAGVAVGVVLSTGVQLARDAIRDRKDRQRELTAAGDTLLGASNALIVLIGLRQRPGVRDEPALGWVEATIREAERTQAAAHAIQRYAAHEVGEAAGRLAATAFKMVGSDDPLAQMGKLNAAIDTFYDAGLHGGLRKASTLRRSRPPQAAQEAKAGS